MGTLWHLQCILILFCISGLNTTGIKHRPTGGIRTWDPETAYLTRCDFNNNSRPFCDWTQPCTVNQGVWIRTKHETPTDGTGPDGDYPDGKGYFIYQEASNLIPFDTNRLESPDIVVSQKICIDFWYYMFGSEDRNELRVLIQDSTGEFMAWSRKGNQSSSWIYGSVTHAFPTQRKIKVIFEAVRGLTEYADTALDNVRVRDGSCDAISTPVPPIPTPTVPIPPAAIEATCTIHGDPHYLTFDKQRHDFMGTCTYTLSKLCENNSSLPYFNVEAANEHRGSNTRVSYVQSVDVDVYGYRINLGKNRVVKVDGVSQILPLTLGNSVSISLSGQYVVVTTDFGLKVKFDGDHRAEITLPSNYTSKVCGICGNYNGDKKDDFLNPDGGMETDSASLGNSWQVYNDSRCLPDDGHTPNCTADEKHMIQSNEYCGLITDPSGPFQNCHSVVDPQSYFEDCQYDLCELHLSSEALCQILQAYADMCQAAGVQLTPWRNATFCPLACPANSHYEPCAAACPATCVDSMAPYNCSLPCVEGCVCDSGYLLYNKQCVPSQQCGCWHNGQHYPVGSEFWTDNTCSSKCTCPTRGGKVQCSSASCPAGQFCGVQNGKPECMDHSYGICHVHGDPHYNTFDKVTHNFMGNCTYTLAKVCSNTSVPYFNVEAKNEHRGNPRVSYVREVVVDVYGERITILKQERSRVLVNGEYRTLPVSAAGGAITVRSSGRYVVLETDFGLQVSYDADHSVEVKVPTSYFNLTCGMCGNFNNRREDDYMMPNGQQAADSNALGESWQVPSSDPSCGVPPPPEPCPADDKKLYESEQFCGMLTARPGFFESCHGVINPQSYFETCSYDLCAMSGAQEVLCGALEAYADACQAAGVTLLPWRNATFCPFACPANSHYNPCTSACPATCTDPLAPNNCSKPCVEGCECNDGFVISGAQCVSMSNCGCLQNDKYYEKGETFWQTNCAGQCECAGNGTVHCNSDTCEASEVCKVQNGLLGCYPLNPSTCHIFGDPHYVTFDGRLYHFQGDCNYTVVETCTNSSEWFSVTTRNKHRGNPNWTALDSVAVTLKNLHIVVRRDKETFVDGVQVFPPVDLKHGARVAIKGHYVVIDTSVGIQVKFDGDQDLFIQVDESLRGQLCGLCGTFNDNQLDDFLKPDKVLEQDPNKFGDSWLVKDDDWVCNPVAVVPPTCDTGKEKEYEEICKIILKNSGPFEVCHWYIPPQLYFESCVYDLCATEGNSDQFCKILEAYAAACELEGVNLGEWRKDTICAAPTACNMSCTFDVDFCEWKQAINDDFDWIRNKGPTLSPNTGPSHDHTTGDGYYIYLQGSQHKPGETASLVSPVCSSTGPHCFRFWYHMYGVAETMALRVYVLHNKTSTLEWKEAGSKGDRWILGEVTVHSTGNLQILLEGMIGEDFRSDVALDDLSIEQGYCPGDVTPAPGPGTTTTVTPAPQPGSGTCVVEGDPHYHTFDKQIHHFMGNCTYTLSKLCESNSSLPYFNVEAANEYRGGNTRVSYVQYVDVDVYGQRIRLGKDGVVTVNGEPEVLPCTPSVGVQVSSSGFYTMVTTDFGLRVKFDGNHRVEVTLPSAFGQKVCGMCGNYNGMAADDFLNPDGVREPDSTSLGNSWQVSNDSSCSAGSPSPPACTEADKQVIVSSNFCGLLTGTSSPFEVCHAVLSPSGYFDTCVYDLCELGLDREALCNSLQSYADACQALGVQIPVWRNATFCPITCPANSHYEPCAAACPATCVDPMAPVTCGLPCVEGCVCDSGYLLYNKQCVPSQQCGCWHNGQHYPVGSEFWTDNTCSSKCTCPTRGGKVQCSSASCPAGQFCGVQNGKPECMDHSYGICHVHGDPHYNTFDKVTHNFMGNCTYTLAKVCSNTSVPYFNVEAKNEHRGNPRVSYVREVVVNVYGERITILKQERSRVLVNGEYRTLPVSAAGGAITVRSSGRYVVLETDFSLQVSYDADHSVEVKVPTSYFNLTCGMCGNFNNRREDDYMMPNGQQAADSNALGESWQVPSSDPSCGVPPPPEPCPADDKKLYESEQFCGMLTARPGFFESCHGVINPQSYFETCSYDLCAMSGAQEVLCGALEAYADACQAAGVTLLPWRNATFCPLPCSANSYYDPCMTGCPATCVDRHAPQNCSKPCVEGCACASGFLLSGDTCVPEASCGCLFEGNYYSEGQSFVSENCSRQCRCEVSGQMVCSALSCGEEEVCKIQDGQRGCFPASWGQCHIYGDPHYNTFDGKLHHFQGSCNYTVVTACDNSSLGFSITTRNEHRGNPSWTALNSVALSVEGVHIALRKKKAVYINGALASLPASPTPNVNISLSGSYVQVSTKLGLQLHFNGDQELLVRVSEKYKGKLCGLCGTYTGSKEDDFRRPDGVVVPDVNDFGASWMVPDDEWKCNTTIPPPVSCSPLEEEAANKKCEILTQAGGPFEPCHSVLPPQEYFESCVYDQCGTGGSTEQLCDDLSSYAAACAAAGVTLGDWSAGTVCGPSTPTPTVSLPGTSTKPPSPTPPGISTPACNFTCTFDVDSVNGYYIYLHGSDPYPGFVSQLVSPVCNSTGAHCFRFWYHMYGVAETMALRVYVSRDGELVEVWKSVGNHGDRWILGEVTVHSTGNLQLVLEGEWGEDFRSDVALDDLSIEQGYCPGDVTPAPGPGTTTPETETSTPAPQPEGPSTPKPGTPLPGITTPPPHPATTTPSSEGPSTPKPGTPLPGITTPPPHPATTTPSSGPSTPKPQPPLPDNTTTPPHPPTPTTPSPSSGRASCSASGDPHYNTFDHKVHNFMGNCSYTLSKVCNISQNIPYFDVSTTNEHRGSNTKVSYVKSVQVEVYGYQISLLKNKKVNVNGSRMNLPIFIEKKISIQNSGGYVLLETDFGLWVRFDGNHYAEVSVPSDYRGLLCGLCGNYNGDPNDDNIKPNGDTASNSNELGQSWLVPENNTMCSVGTEDKCDAVLESEAKKNTACGMITDPTGIFKDCHSKVPPENFFNNCVYDVCFTDGQATSLCYGLQAYAESCINAGICIEWRNATLCPMSCPGGSIYKGCGTRCPSTCVSSSAANTCSTLPVEGCFCKDGYVLSGDTCVPESSCGCLDNKNHYHELGESWFTNHACTERCTCNANNVISCSSWECGVREECSVKDGVLGCHSNGQVTCQVAGDPHYFTFDKLMYTFVGTCTYTLVKSVSHNVNPITILGKNEDRGLRGATYLKEVYIDVYDTRITLRKSKEILLNNQRVYTPVENRVRGVSIGNVGNYLVVETDFGVIVKYDGDDHLEITLPQSYFSKVQGMCGNFNDDYKDDLSLPNGTIVSVTQFGNSWKVEEDSDAGCLSDSREDDVPPCTSENKPIIESQCNVLKSDKFKACHHLVKPEDFIKICTYDMCQYDGMKSALCDIVQFYVDTCRNQGVTITWRNSTFCPLPCPSHSHYTACASACPSTCNDIFASSLCEKTESCTEGCECDDNYVLSNDKCVPLSNCGCRDDDNNYYSAGETWITPHCAKRCQCQRNGVIKCQSYGCDSKESCLIKNGKYKCNPTGFGMCRIIGDPHYITFDGLVHHFQGKFTYILTQTIPGLPDTLTPFSVEGMNFPLRLNRRITYLKEIIINVYNHEVRFRQGKQILLDGVKVRAPIRPHDGIHIYQRITRVYLETDFGLYLSYDGDQNADIKLANTYNNRVEGLCGNFDGRYKNDFTNPDGVWLKNVNAFGESWKVPVKRRASRFRRETTMENEPDEEPDTGLYQGCSENKLMQENSTSKCQILTALDGPFANCHSAVPPEPYSMNCIFDMCVEEDGTDTLCRHLKEYVLACQEQGVNIEGWRQQTGCEMVCPPNSKYNSCVTACPASCSDMTSPSECELPCTEGCECLPGYVLSDSNCVPYRECGCTYLDKYYEIGEVFTTDDCSQKCRCTESSTVTCSNIACGSDEICDAANYTRGCYRRGPCMPSPCQNDGICSETTNDTSGNYYCECTELYTGRSCDIERIDDSSIPESSQSNTVAIAVGVTVAVVAVIILITSAVYLFRKNSRKANVNIGAQNASLHKSEDTPGDGVREHNYGYVVNAAFDRDEPHSTYL
ncbi:IgGFc-binding protein-like [Coturnix japonica]|uniref:IgGFc-binding protein-like n=1 Tax=Coturnix japonica TaxID=93934 RepID=UPI0013A5E251|nr:IgGFc-binding protein-like [Coturnix japonica]